MNSPQNRPSPEHVRQGLVAADASTRLRAAMAAGTYPAPDLIDTLVTRSGVEPDFFVRDMLTWALMRHPSADTVPRLLTELRSDRAQARSQALHSLSKIRSGHAWEAVRASLTDSDPKVSRSAWRGAVVLAPREERPQAIATMSALLGRGDAETQRSLSRALVTLAGDIEDSDTGAAGSALHRALQQALTSPDPAVRIHASATELLWRDPDAGFEASVAEAQKVRTQAASARSGAG